FATQWSRGHRVQRVSSEVRGPIIGPYGTANRTGVASAEEPGAVDDVSDTFDVSTCDARPEMAVTSDDDEVALTVRATRVHHPPEAYGLRMTSASGRVLAYSGDSAYCDQLVDVAAGAGVILCDEAWTRAAGRPPGSRVA